LQAPRHESKLRGWALTGRGGRIAAVFAADSEPIDARVIDAIMMELPLLE
jgi:hypothetical protein